MEESILQGIGYAIPALVTGAVAYFVMSGLRNQDTNEANRRFFRSIFTIIAS
jgi:hypothetical protein